MEMSDNMLQPTDASRHLNTVRFLSAAAVAEIPVTYADIREILHDNLRAKAVGEVENPPKPGIHPMPHAFIHAMPGYVAPTETAGLKWISGFPDNPAQGLPYIAGVIVLNDARTGLVTAIMDAGRVTALRTAGVSGVAIEVLRGDSPATAAIIGCGVQGRAHLDMLLELFPRIGDIRLCDALPGRAQDVADSVDSDGRCRAVDTVQAAVDGADVVLTAVAEREGGDPIRPEWLTPGALLVPLANDFGWTPEAMATVTANVVDDIPQYTHFRGIGELERSAGVPDPVELCDVLTGRVQVRRAPDERSCALNIGLAIHDVATAAYVSRLAEQHDLGQMLEL